MVPFHRPRSHGSIPSSEQLRGPTARTVGEMMYQSGAAAEALGGRAW
ncbi:hypothetical protein LINPERHAP2_LOCUS6041 [Linum perenne]